MVPAVDRNRYVANFPRKSSVGTAVFRMPGVIPTTGAHFSIDMNDFRESQIFRTASHAPLDASARAHFQHFVKILITGTTARPQ